MKKEEITIHSNLHDFINYKALIEAQANQESFLDKPIVENDRNFKKTSTKPKVKRLIKSYKEKDSTRKKW